MELGANSQDHNFEAFKNMSVLNARYVVLKKFLSSGGDLLACGSCLELRHQEAGVCPISTMAQLVEMIADSDKVVSLG